MQHSLKYLNDANVILIRGEFSSSSTTVYPRALFVINTRAISCCTYILSLKLVKRVLV